MAGSRVPTDFLKKGEGVQKATSFPNRSWNLIPRLARKLSVKKWLNPKEYGVVGRGMVEGGGGGGDSLGMVGGSRNHLNFWLIFSLMLWVDPTNCDILLNMRDETVQRFFHRSPVADIEYLIWLKRMSTVIVSKKLQLPSSRKYNNADM